MIAVQELITNSLKSDAGIKSALGNPARIYDAPVKHALMPFAVWRRWEQKPIAGDYEGAVEYTATIEITCKNNGIDDAKSAVSAIQKWAINAKPEDEQTKIILIMTNYADVYRAIDGRTFLGVVRLKILVGEKEIS